MIKSILKYALKPFWMPLQVRIEQIVATPLAPKAEQIALQDQMITILQQVKDIHIPQLNVLSTETNAYGT